MQGIVGEVSDIFLWTPTYGCNSVGWPAKTYRLQFCTDTGCSLEDLPVGMDGKKESGNLMLIIYIYIYIYIL